MKVKFLGGPKDEEIGYMAIKKLRAPRIIAISHGSGAIMYELVGICPDELRYSFIPTIASFKKSLQPAGTI